MREQVREQPREIVGSLITIGDEVLFGSIANGNAHHIAGELRANGFRLATMVTVGDQPAAIRDALLEAMGRKGFVICTGGLGPTSDDRTAEAVAAALDRPLLPNLPYEALLRARLARRGIPWSETIGKMALLPEGASKLGGDIPAAGFFVEHGETPCYFLPGVPWEMRMFMAEHVLPDLRRRFPQRPVYRKRILRVQELPESQINQRLRDLEAADSGVEIGYLPQTAENWVTLLAVAADDQEALSLISGAEREVLHRLGAGAVSGCDEETLETVVGRFLRARSWKLALAESCTGGLLCARISAVAGASDYLDRAFVTYSNQAKVELLGVPEALLAAHGAVSAPVAAAMATGARERAAADLALAVTGIAGPSGGTPEKPVGTVFIACASQRGVAVKEHHFSGDRQQIQEKSVQGALVLLWRELSA
jgi:nicotinamide-nucleotide amidase